MADKDRDTTAPIGAMSEETLTRIMTAAALAARQPSEAEVKKEAEEKARIAQRRITMRRLVETERAAVLKRQSLCTHRKPDGEEASGGQAFSDGTYRKLCLRCQKWLVVQATPEMTLARAELDRLVAAGQLSIKDGKIQIAQTIGA